MTGEWRSSVLGAAHEHCVRNRDEIERSASCGCFHCISTFPPSEINDWIEDYVEEGPMRCRELRPVTATCPMCDVDSVLGDASGYPVVDAAFLRAMHMYYF